MNSTRLKEIEALADLVHQTLALGVPANVDDAVVKLGGSIVFIREASVTSEARIRKVSERFVIELKQGTILARQRFSIAHELGHLFLHMGYLISPDKWQRSGEYSDSIYHRIGYGVEEQEANQFAAALLMPKEAFEKALRAGQSGNTLARLRHVSKMFGTSLTATIRRGEDLGFIKSNSKLNEQ